MKEALALNLLGQIMGWDAERARTEFAWLSTMSRFKYDGYDDYLAGVRFVERLAAWLQQFDEPQERETAYDFVSRRLTYVSRAEIGRLVECFVPQTLRPLVVADTARELGVRGYQIWSCDEYRSQYERHLRRTLFMGLSDGARTDVLRRANARTLSNEQVVVDARLDPDKWRNLGQELGQDPRFAEYEGKVLFDRICLLDDFTASGTSLLRRPKGVWKGKLIRFHDAMMEARNELGAAFPVVAEPKLLVHHYMATKNALAKVTELIKTASKENGRNWLASIHLTCGLRLEPSLRVTEENEPEFVALAHKYYDETLEDRHHEESDADSMALGYAACALPVVLEHNTPNNSVALLWAHTDGKRGHAMRALFRRRSRHS